LTIQCEQTDEQKLLNPTENFSFTEKDVLYKETDQANPIQNLSFSSND
jgi:hypothetical protein